MKSRVRTREQSFPGGRLVLGLLTCFAVFWLGVQGGDHLTGGLSTAALLGAFAAIWIAPVLLAVTVIWGGFAFFRWFWIGR
jgi:hypothetical protein